MPLLTYSILILILFSGDFLSRYCKNQLQIQREELKEEIMVYGRDSKKTEKGKIISCQPRKSQLHQKGALSQKHTTNAQSAHSVRIVQTHISLICDFLGFV